jgi:hypothetical protein
MIYDSQYWKNDLQKNVFFLFEKLDQKVWREASFAALEKRVMLSCYIVRKLAEASKIPQNLFSADVPLYRYKNAAKVVDPINFHKVDELYEIQNAQKINNPFSYIVNQIIHSFIFWFAFNNDGRLEGILFNSDRSKNKELYMIKVQDLIDALSPIAQCYISRAVLERNEDGELVVVQAE